MLAIGHGISPVFSSHAGFPTFRLDTTLATFTAKMAKRSAPGPFSIAPIVQGHYDVTGTPDILTCSRGSQISGTFYSNIDSNQGSVVLWWTPEKDRTAAHTTAEMLYSFDADGYIRYEHNNARFRIRFGNQSYFIL